MKPAFDPPATIALTAARAAPDAHLAIGTLTMRYQPVVRLDDGRTSGLEALVRRSEPAGGLLPPAGFLAGLESAGLGAQVAEIVIRTTLAEFVDSELSLTGLRVGINLPLDVLLTDHALDVLEDARAAAGLLAADVVIELTESQPVRNLPALRRAVARLDAHGYRVAIDDYTPEMPNGPALLDLPFKYVKLDMSVIRCIDSRFLLDTLEAAACRGLAVCAEGVNSLTCWRRLRDAGVELAQGYWIGPPLASSLVQPWLATWNARRPAL